MLSKKEEWKRWFKHSTEKVKREERNKKSIKIKINGLKNNIEELIRKDQ